MSALELILEAFMTPGFLSTLDSVLELSPLLHVVNFVKLHIHLCLLNL